tara:strand:+ start:361 stop:492 length:132 start_codon:yes stop_codon:yes gene_type:complete
MLGVLLVVVLVLAVGAYTPSSEKRRKADKDFQDHFGDTKDKEK